jgi:hypothetical protein
MIDLILWCNTKAGFVTFAKAHPAGNPLMQDVTDPITGVTTTVVREGVRWCWWGGDGQMMKTKAVMSGMTVVTPATYVPGFVMLMTIYRDDDVLAATGEQFVKSKVAKYIKDNGVFGRTSAANGNIPYYELSGVRIFRPQDVETWLAANGLPGHQWVGGNQY